MNAYKSKDEERLNSELSLLLRAKEIIRYDYEEMAFQVGVARSYTPDFVVEYSDRVEIIEVKGYPKIITNRRRNHPAEAKAREIGINKFMCAAYFRHDMKTYGKLVYFRLVERKGREWKTIYLIQNRKKIKPFPLHAREVNEK